MQMGPAEKLFVNNPLHTHRVARSNNLDVTGVDVDPAQVRSAQRRCRGDANVRFFTVDGTQLPFPDADFDIVATQRATHHIPHWETAVEEMLRVLKPGASFHPRRRTVDAR